MFGQSDLKLVSDGQPGSWGTWVGPTVWGHCTSFTASFEASFKNGGGGGPGDGFSFWFGDMEGVTDFSGGEQGLNSILNADRGITASFVSYPGANPGVYAKQGVTTFASNGLGYDPMTYSDHLQAKDDSGHGRFRVEWDINSGLQIYVGWSWMEEEVLWVDAQGIQPTDAHDWTFGFSARNGGIDQDVFIDNLVITAVPAPGSAVALVGLAGLGRRRRRDSVRVMGSSVGRRANTALRHVRRGLALPRRRGLARGGLLGVAATFLGRRLAAGLRQVRVLRGLAAGDVIQYNGRGPEVAAFSLRRGGGPQ